MLTLCCSLSWRTDGRRSPLLSAPASIAASICSAMRW
jgi:hypothetical protein